MFSTEKQEMHLKHHKKNIWCFYSNMILAIWLITSPTAFEYEVKAAIWNDIICGFILLFFSFIALNAYRLWAQWGIVFLGLWLLFAPLIFSVKSGAAYLTDTLVATLMITFTIIVPGQPGIKLFAEPGPDIPPGWSYNPSTWLERIPVITLAWIGFFIGRYLGAFQLGFIDHAWDPFFGEGTRKVLTSKVSESFPVSDGMLGAVSYLLDVLFGKAGGIDRWRTMPWIVIIFAILIVPLGAVSITLVILQPVTVGNWCTLCLASAFISLAMIPFTLDEALASVQLLMHEKKKGRPIWQALWFGGTMEGGRRTEPNDPTTLLQITAKGAVKDFLNKPWNLFISFAIGIWIMSAPALFGFPKPISDCYHLVGALIATFAVIAMSEVARIVRFINMPLGVLIAISPWLFNADTHLIIWVSLISGLVVIPLSFPKGSIEDQRGGFEKYII